MSGTLYSSVAIPHSELLPDRHLPSYMMGSFTTMSGKVWNMSRVTVRDGDERLLTKEMEIMNSVSHPQVLLLMGHCPPNQKQRLKLVYEPVIIGSLYHCLHEQGLYHPLLDSIDILLQVSDGLMFLAGRGLVHRAVTSHAVQLVNKCVAKLGMLEMTVKEGKVVSRPSDIGVHCLYNWLSPEVLLREHSVAQKEGDVYSLCCLLWELCMNEIPWGDREPMEIVSSISRGETLPLSKDRVPRLLYRVLRHGLIWDVEQRDLDLEEVRDMLLLSRGELENKLARSGDLNIPRRSSTNMGQGPEPTRVQETVHRRNHEKPVNHILRFPTSDLSLFTSSALQTDILRYLGDHSSRAPQLKEELSHLGGYDQFEESSTFRVSSSESNLTASTSESETDSEFDNGIPAKKNSISPVHDKRSVKTANCRYPIDRPHPSYYCPPFQSCKSGPIAGKDPQYRPAHHKIMIPRKVEIPPAYRRRSRHDPETQSRSLPRIIADKGRVWFEGEELAGAADRDFGEMESTYDYGVNKGVRHRIPDKTKYSSRRGKTVGLTKTQVMNCLMKKPVSFPSIGAPKDNQMRKAESEERTQLKPEAEHDYNTNFRDKFLSTRQFFEKTSLNQDKQTNDSADIYFTPQTTTKSNSRISTPGTFLQPWTTPPADFNSTKEEVLPEVGSVLKTIGLLEVGTLGQSKLRDDSCYMSAADSPSSYVVQPSRLQLAKHCASPNQNTKECKATQTSFPTPALSHSTPKVSHHQAPPSSSPLFCSPLLPPNHPISRPSTMAGLLKLNSLEQSSMDSIRYAGSIPLTSEDINSTCVDFSKPEGRQTAFTTALSQAQQESSGNGQFDTCSEFVQDGADDDLVRNEARVKAKSPQVVTFNSCVEEITTSIVSLEPESHVVSSSSSQSTVKTISVTELEDFYYDEQLHPSLELDPNNMQLLSTIPSQASRDWEEDEQFNTAELELGLSKNDSTSSDYNEVVAKNSLTLLAGAEPQSQSNNAGVSEEYNEETRYQSVVEDTVWEDDLANESFNDKKEEVLEDEEQIETEFEQDSEIIQYRDVKDGWSKQDEDSLKVDDPKEYIEETRYQSVVEDTDREEDIVCESFKDKNEEVLEDEEQIETEFELDSERNQYRDVEFGWAKQEEGSVDDPNVDVAGETEVSIDEEIGWNCDEEEKEWNEKAKDQYRVDSVVLEESTVYEEAKSVVENESGKEDESEWNDGETSVEVVGEIDNDRNVVSASEVIERNGNDEETNMPEWRVGDECVARWEEDGCWYKAVVDEVMGDTASVTFTEYGDSARCTFEYMRDKTMRIGEDGQLVVTEYEYGGDWD